jgi:CO/xanthine dehydrogenase Mo-binding subunit
MVVGYLLQEAARKLKDTWRDGKKQRVSQTYTQPPGITWDGKRFRGDAYPAYGYGINVIEVSVDPATYEIGVENVWTVYDVGVAIDQRIVEGQAHGGMIQALGYAALEKLELEAGRFKQVTMADYTIPTSVDYPATATDFVDNPYPFGPFGAKGAGELVFDGAAPALALAVQQAIGKHVCDLPLTPESLSELTS